LKSLKNASEVEVAASPMVATSIALLEGKPYVFFANFAGLHGGVNPVQTPPSGGMGSGLISRRTPAMKTKNPMLIER
jgi:hypothetical protein